MASEIVQGGFDHLSKKPETKIRPMGMPDPAVEAELDWVAVQIAPNANGGLAVLEELRGWWVGNDYVHVKEPFRTRIVSTSKGQVSASFDSSVMWSEAAQ